MKRLTSSDLKLEELFSDRHIGLSAQDVWHMLDVVGQPSVPELIDAAIPTQLRTNTLLNLPAAVGEREMLMRLRELADQNVPGIPMIGMGYYGTHTPAVLRRNIVENPSWYTAYTPYQPEISQGRLEALLNFQTMVCDLTAMPIAGASLLDEGSAAAEAVALLRRHSKAANDAVVVLDTDVFAQTQAVITTRCIPQGITVVSADIVASRDPLQALRTAAGDREIFGVVVQLPGASGALYDLREVIDAAHQTSALVCVAADLLACTVVTPPGELGADVAVGTTQRFGMPMAFGGPHAAYIAVREGLERLLPGRIVGVSKTVDGSKAYRLAMQTREQHIRREKATSNICTAQVLAAVVAGMFAVYHGAGGLQAIAERVAGLATRLADTLRGDGVNVVHQHFFDTLLVRVPGQAERVVALAAESGILLRLIDADHVGISCDETTTLEHISMVSQAFGAPSIDDGTLPDDNVVSEAIHPEGEQTPADSQAGHSDSGHRADVPSSPQLRNSVPGSMRRTSTYLQHPVFQAYHSETRMMRYLRELAQQDYALDRGMIPLGSCTMKLTGAALMEPLSWPQWAQLHPLAPANHSIGIRRIISDLEQWLAVITGYDVVSVQPNAGSQGELAGLLTIRQYHLAAGDTERKVCLLPASAHGTNAASAALAGMDVVVVRCDDGGNIDVDHLQEILELQGHHVAAMMVTYPSTHGVYEDTLATICELVHDAGGQVYVDGANLNALVGLVRFGQVGADVCHVNLHKTFAMPHGGGGPGVGPVAMKSHLAPHLPMYLTSAPFGSAGLLPISWAYIGLMGPDGLTRATAAAVLSANYIAARLDKHYPVLYRGRGNLVAHECIVDLRPLTKQSGITVDDVAKRLIDYGFHAPTMSFPVPGTLMIEPTESEDLAELDRFCDAMIAIHGEADKVASGGWPKDDNPLVNAPHTAQCLAQEWSHPYDRSVAAYPAGVDPKNKYWTPVRRIDGAYGDRNLMCMCVSPQDLVGDA